MQQNMIIHGVFFGGGWKGAGIYMSTGLLSGRELTLADVRYFGDRMELAEVILDTRRPWALDFPFALPEAVYRAFSLRDWEALLNFVEVFEQSELEAFLDRAELYGPEGRCQSPGDGCRLTDALSGALSPLRRYWPNRLRMTCEGLRLLAYLRRHGVSVYPLDRPDYGHSRVYEVDPWNTLSRLGMGWRASSLRLVDAFNGLEGRPVELLPFRDTLYRDYSIEAVVSCATLAYAIRAFGLDDWWHGMPACATAPEWEIRQREGLIVRLQSGLRQFRGAD
jgi:hypothetical protein